MLLKTQLEPSSISKRRFSSTSAISNVSVRVTVLLKKFGNRVADVRKQRNITQEKLADMVDLHRTYIGFIEQGKRNPSIGNIQKIAKALKVSLPDLFKNL